MPSKSLSVDLTLLRKESANMNLNWQKLPKLKHKEEQRVKKKQNKTNNKRKQTGQNTQELADNIKWPNIYAIGIPEDEERYKRAKNNI